MRDIEPFRCLRLFCDAVRATSHHINTYAPPVPPATLRHLPYKSERALALRLFTILRQRESAIIGSHFNIYAEFIIYHTQATLTPRRHARASARATNTRDYRARHGFIINACRYHYAHWFAAVLRHGKKRAPP